MSKLFPAMENTVTISKKEYFELQLAACRLEMLEGGGVDNWDGYGDSLFPEFDDWETIEDIEERLKKEIFGKE